MKILSIDFDYFQEAIADTMRECYPDGIDLSTSLSTIVWSVKYSVPTYKEQLEKVRCREDELNMLIDILQNQDTDTKIMVANSHRHIYDFICDEADVNASHEVAHIDMHHDLFNENKDKVDCGNWLGELSKKYKKMTATWFNNPVTNEVYGIEDLNLPTKTTIASLRNTKFDLIYLCRSDNWTPPHLDNYFEQLLDVIRGHFRYAKVERAVMKPRAIMNITPDVLRGERRNNDKNI